MRRAFGLVRLYGAGTFCYGTDMAAATQGKASMLARTLFVFALAHFCATAPHARQTPPAQRTGRSYDTAAPPRRTAPAAPQSPSPVVFADVTAQVEINFKH